MLGFIVCPVFNFKESQAVNKYQSWKQGGYEANMGLFMVNRPVFKVFIVS